METSLRIASRDDAEPSVPAWIESSHAWRVLPPRIKHALEIIAASADHVAPDGTLDGSLGGASLVRRCGCSRSTFRSRVGKLALAGFLSVHATPGRGNEFSIPGVSGSGRLIFSADQSAGSKNEPAQKRPDVPQTKKRAGSKPSDRLIDKKTQSIRGKSSNRIPPLDPSVVHDVRKVLAYFEVCVRAGIADESDRLDFVAGSIRARRKGDDPSRLFAWMVLHRNWSSVSGGDEDAAVRAIRDAEDGQGLLSDDSKLVQGAIEWKKSKGVSGDLLDVIRRFHTDWDQARLDAAYAGLMT